jgi:hypothetical protein
MLITLPIPALGEKRGGGRDPRVEKKRDRQSEKSVVQHAGCECNLIRLARTVVADQIPGSPVGGWGATVQGRRVRPLIMCEDGSGGSLERHAHRISRNYGPVLRG